MRWEKMSKRIVRKESAAIKKFLLGFLTIALMLSCGNAAAPNLSPTKELTSKIEGEGDMTAYDLTISVGNHMFEAKLYDNETTKALIGKFPLTINMGDMNGNEKYYFMPDNLPTNAENPRRINEGDLMLYGSNCLVLFYETFSSSYSYTKLGYIKNAATLAQAVGGGNVQITFNFNNKK